MYLVIYYYHRGLKVTYYDQNYNSEWNYNPTSYDYTRQAVYGELVLRETRKRRTSGFVGL
jgi:hypothetical protein